MAQFPVAQSEGNVFRFDQSGALLRKVMESAAVGMTVVGADFRMIYVNRAFEAMLGYESDACAGLDLSEMLHAGDRQNALLRLSQLMRGEVEEFRFECRMQHRDGVPLWAMISAALLKSEGSGRPLYSIIQVVNIDRQKRAEEALARSESRWNFALEAARQGVWDYDAISGQTFYSRTWRTMRGIDPGEYVDSSRDKWLARLHPDDRARVDEVTTRQERGEDGYDIVECRERHRDGHYIWILSRGRPIEWDAEGRRARVVGTDTDITHLKRIEAALQGERERFRTTLDAIADGVISTDADRRITFMNPAAETMTGWHGEDAIGRLITDVFVLKTEATGEPATDAICACLASNFPTEIEADAILAARDGIGRGVSGIASPLRAEDGQTVGAVLVFRDVTDTQELHRQLSHSANHDPLTGLVNRSAFGRALAEAQRQAIDEQRSHALCFIDLDRFKPVNDGAGHSAGDAMLQKVAQCIRNTSRSADCAGRLGGDEFVLLLADCSVADARKVANKLIEAISSIQFAWNGASYSIGASVGIAPVTAERGRDPLAEADSACYAAKAAGRGRVETAAA